MPYGTAMLPATLVVAAPFPNVRSQTSSVQTIAPGIEFAQYTLVTDDGPIVVHIAAAVAHRNDIRIDSALANNALTSSGETVSAMARRTGAVAGINADYFDIGNTNRPTNIVVESGQLVRTPRKRYALIITNGGEPVIAEESFVGQAQIGSNTIGLDAINELPPPDGGTSLITPQFGTVPPQANTTLVSLTPRSGVTPFAQYSTIDIADNGTPQPAGYYLAIGVNAYGRAGVPNPGDQITVNGDLSPVNVANIGAAVGGGPMILHQGQFFDDPDGPNGGEYSARIPASGAAIGFDGTLYLLEVDGRQSDLSIGITRPEFAALMRAFGAAEGLAFDGGGSSALAVRTRGAASAHLVTSPSDGIERKVADGIFIYSTAPVGAATQLVAEPEAIRALPGAEIPLRVAALDAAEHVVGSEPASITVDPASLGAVRDGIFHANLPGNGNLILRAGPLQGRVPIEIAREPARITIVPAHAAIAENGSITLRAHGFDAFGNPLALPAALPWRASTGTIDSSGTLHVERSDSVVSLLIGEHLASTGVLVGSREVSMHLDAAHYMTSPRGGDGAVELSQECEGCLVLQYHLRDGVRAAYAVREQPLPNGTVALHFEVKSDGSGAHLKVALRNAINEEILLNAATLDTPGWRHITVALPATFSGPGRFTAFYVIAPSGGDSIDGSIVFRSFTASAAGSP